MHWNKSEHRLKHNKMVKRTFEAIGTKWQIDIYDNISSSKEEEIFRIIDSRIEIFDKNYSRFRKDSLVTEMSKKIGDYVLPADAKPMIDLYENIYKMTDGLVTPLIGNLISDVGYDADYSLKQKNVLNAPPRWGEALEYKFPELKVKIPVILDFGAAGKGYLIDIVGKILEENNIKSYCIDAGGDILHRGNESIRIGLENSTNLDEVIGIVNIKNKSICGSSGNRRVWQNFNHIINPKTLSSPKDILAVWTTSDTTLIADAMSTCLFFVKPEIIRDYYNFEYLIVYSDKTYKKSDDFGAEMFG